MDEQEHATMIRVTSRNASGKVDSPIINFTIENDPINDVVDVKRLYSVVGFDGLKPVEETLALAALGEHSTRQAEQMHLNS